MRPKSSLRCMGDPRWMFIDLSVSYNNVSGRVGEKLEVSVTHDDANTLALRSTPVFSRA